MLLEALRRGAEAAFEIVSKAISKLRRDGFGDEGGPEIFIPSPGDLGLLAAG